MGQVIKAAEAIASGVVIVGVLAAALTAAVFLIRKAWHL